MDYDWNIRSDCNHKMIRVNSLNIFTQYSLKEFKLLCGYSLISDSSIFCIGSPDSLIMSFQTLCIVSLYPSNRTPPNPSYHKFFAWDSQFA